MFRLAVVRRTSITTDVDVLLQSALASIILSAHMCMRVQYAHVCVLLQTIDHECVHVFDVYQTMAPIMTSLEIASRKGMQVNGSHRARRET